MSKIGKSPIKVPNGVEVTVDGRDVLVKGPKGSLSRRVSKGILVENKDGVVVVSREAESVPSAFWGLERALIANMVIGVSGGFTKELEMVGIGYRVKIEGDNLIILAGYSHPVKISIPEGLEVSVNNETNIAITGIDKQRVGQFAAIIRKVRPPEPYKGKGIKYKDEIIKRKAGKAGKAGATGVGA